MKPVDILRTAASLVGGDRAKQHGDYVLLHKRVADLWSRYLGADITPEQVAFCMVLLKVSRDELGSPNPDNGVDATAYTALWAAITEEKNA
jgi:hypothetical protein|tara:strand:- start:251 stop:523 length:273 start_codon:yes stop_codon:yes gene_type:complete